MDTAQTENLKVLALAATPGEWTAENHERQNDDCEYWRIESEYGTVCGDEGIWWPPVEGSNEGNAKWIAAACPATVLALIAEVERIRVARDKTLEEAATVADAERAEFMSKAGANNGRESDFAFGSVNSAERIAASIRALKGAAIAASKEKA